MSLVVQDLSKKYGTRTVVDHLSFEINRPGVYALLGTNGAGKTTSIRMMLGMLSRDSGTVTWNGKPLDINTCNVGYLAEERGLYPKYTIMDQLMYFAALRGVSASEAKKRIHYWAERFDIIEYLYPQEYADIQAKKARMHEEASPKKKGLFGSGNQRKKRIAPKTADQLSKGNQQKIQMIAALISDPELLILDEPLSGLDPVNTDLFKDIIHEQINKGKYLIMSDHQMSTIEEFCTDLTILDHSKTILSGNLNTIKKSYGRVHLFLKTESDITSYIHDAGISILSELAGEYHLKVTGEAQANALLGTLIQAGITIVTFNLREPSLHEIFVSKVGEAHEE